jgi:hypothetical protein
MQTMLPPSPSEDPTDPMTEALVLKRLVRHLESHPHSPISIDSLAHEFDIKRRGLYDFITICSTFDICRRITHNSLEWCGISRSIPILKTIRLECRQEPPDRSLKEIFNYSLDASLQRIAVAVIKLFFMLKLKFLDLRKVSRLLAQKNMKYQTMLRKLYTVVSGLEVARIVHKTEIVSQIQFLVPLDIGIELPELKVCNLLNTQDDIEDQKRSEARRKEFEELCSEMGHKEVFRDGLAFTSTLQSVATWA